MKKVAIYARVSTDKQNCENQLIELRAVAARSGYTIVTEFLDEGISGAKGRADRPALDALIDLPPSSRTNVMFVKSVTMENDGHEEEQIYRRTDHWVLAASRSRHAD